MSPDVLPNALELMARHLVRALYDATDGQPMRWREVAGLSRAIGTAAAIAFAVDRGWMLLEGGHSVCLTEAGRRLAEDHSAARS